MISNLLPDQEACPADSLRANKHRAGWVDKVRQDSLSTRRRNHVHKPPSLLIKKTCQIWGIIVSFIVGLGYSPWKATSNLLVRECLVCYHDCKWPTGSQQRRWLTHKAFADCPSTLCGSPPLLSPSQCTLSCLSCIFSSRIKGLRHQSSSSIKRP